MSWRGRPAAAGSHTEGKKIFERSDLFVSKIRVQGVYIFLFFSVGGSKNIGYWQRRCVAECVVWQCVLKKINSDNKS